MLVAGTSCVDYSNLNNQKQDIEAKGESGETFRGMLNWVKKHRPSLVILENVCGAVSRPIILNESF
jgi:site-specific DNA-cytosine methylase